LGAGPAGAQKFLRESHIRAKKARCPTNIAQPKSLLLKHPISLDTYNQSFGFGVIQKGIQWFVNQHPIFELIIN
jgi:hypothetical protein